MMTDTKQQVLSFLEKCEELKSCKFIMATTKIKDLLKCIVNCPDLYRLFETVTKKFDYPNAKAECLITEESGAFDSSRVELPQTVGERLAFIFCLFVEFDRETLNFNDFLRQYFVEDGSYFESYRAFCNLIVKSLQECVLRIFEDDLETLPEGKPDSAVAELISALDISVSQEMQYVSDSSISEDDKENGLKILSELLKALKAGNENLIDALLCGYNYFILHTDCVSDGITELIQMIEAFEKKL